MLLNGPRLSHAKKILNIPNDNVPIFVAEGDWQQVYQLDKNWVAKRLKTHNFGKTIFTDLSSALKLKDRVHRHLGFLRNIFSDFYPMPRVFVDEVIAENNQKVYTVNKIQRNLNSFEHENTTAKTIYTPLDITRNLSPLFISQNLIFLNDLHRLFSGWKKLRSMGISLDISFGKNITTVKTSQGLRLKIFDSIPIYMDDIRKFKKAKPARGLILLKIDDFANPPKGYKDSLVFFNFLEDLFQQVHIRQALSKVEE